MSYVFAVPEMMSAAATDLAAIESMLSQASVAATAGTTTVPAAGADEVSAAIAALFSAHGQTYQALSARAAAFHQQFVQLMTIAADSYASAETAPVAPLQSLLG
ncbi:PE family protein [Mycobacterium intermedium]|uniref:PE family protein n=1 Tax=Mycobacterium intermedium TaxID=28445 RepID=A0A1E3SF89_MYCIE|nr:PE family protein [Mycobacterium intermedium]ODR00819.1 hypothetical protein BHQ20_11565 [Mycobacterium intermedium]OPE52138.1 PE family protein [Mycobacterium intermedium]ORB10574.1 PE family protein [Mycobacterium intermedium]